MIDAQFDFNLYDKAVGAIAFDGGSWTTSGPRMNRAQAYGAHHFDGQHHRTRTAHASRRWRMARSMSTRT